MGQKGCKAAGGTDGCAGAKNMAAKGLVSKTAKIAAIRLLIWTKQARSDRGFLVDSGGRTAGLDEIGALRSRFSG